MKKARLYLIILLILSAFAAGCSSSSKSPDTTEKEKLTVYTTIYPLEDFTKKIGGEHVEVASIYPPGADAHTYEPTQKVILKIANADLFIYNGAGMESFTNKLTDTLSKENVKIVESTEGISLIDHSHEHEEENEDGHDHDHGEEGHHHHDVDPHVWLDPVLAMQQANSIKEALIELKPDAEEDFEKNYAAIKKQFEELDNKFRETVDHAPKKEILVAHEAYGYWEKRYGIEQISVTGLSPTNEPSQKKLAEIIEIAKEHELNYIIFETFATPKIADIVKKEIGAEILRMHHLSSQSEEDKKENKDYFDLMNENIETLQKALQ